MNQKFQSAVHHKDDVTYVKLAGVIDEDNDLSEVGEQVQSGTAVIDLSEVERINSCGVRDWVNWLNKIEAEGSKVVLVECSPAIVAQINLVNNFTGAGVVKNFFAPYFCPNCDREKVLLLEAAELGSDPTSAPTCRCDECDGVMDFDDMEDSYFAFLSTAQNYDGLDRVQAVVDEFSPAEGEKSRIRSRVGSTTMAGGSGTTLPSVPSLPSISRGTGPGIGTGTGGGAFPPVSSKPGGLTPIPPPAPRASASDPALDVRVRRDSRPDVWQGKPSQQVAPSSAPPAPGSGLIYVLVFVLIAAIGVLAFLIFSDWPLPMQ